MKIVAEKENKAKVIVDVHRNSYNSFFVSRINANYYVFSRLHNSSNLRIFEKHYKNEGFVVTERKSRDNPYYLEAELLLNEDYCIK